MRLLIKITNLNINNIIINVDLINFIIIKKYL